MSADDIRVVLVTTPDRDSAVAVARQLVSERLAACGNILPGITSIFRWEGAVQEEAEALLVLKTDGSRLAKLIQRAVELHPYDVPEVIAIPVVDGHRPYLSWVKQSVTEGPE